jgi:hypothetical protein
MSKPTIAFRVHYLNVQPSDELSAAVEQGLSLLAPFGDRVTRCDVHIGRWVQHHAVSQSYRVTLELEPRAPALPVSVECESEPDAAPDALLLQVGVAFRRAAKRLSERAQHAAALSVPLLSPDARRLHPLHGLAPEDSQLGADDA